MSGKRAKKAAPSSPGTSPAGQPIQFGMTLAEAKEIAGGDARSGGCLEDERPWLGCILHAGGTPLPDRDVPLGDGVVKRIWRVPSGALYMAEVWNPDGEDPHRLVRTRRIEA